MAICTVKVLSWFSWFWPFSVVFLTNFGLKMSFFLSNTPKMTHSDKCFHMRPIGASEYHFGEYKHIRMDGLKLMRIAFFGIIGFLQKTLAARISAPRRGTEAVQYSKLSSGGPLCSQTSSSPWGSIRRAPEPQK